MGKMRLPANVEIVENSDGTLTVYIDDEMFDGAAPPKAERDAVIRAIRKHGRDWAWENPQWMVGEPGK